MFTTKVAAGALALFTLVTTAVPAFAAGAELLPGVAPSPVAAVSSPATLSKDESAALQYMREEEKLAHDVYVALYDAWGARVFKNIAASEQRHTDAVAVLLTRYAVSDPTAGNGPGEFTDPALQTLYDELVAQGSESLIEALKVGAAIEEIDINDLKARMAETEQADILAVYGNLLAGSENHLRAFVNNLERQSGEPYVPQYMDPGDYESIISSAGSADQIYLPSLNR